MSEVKVPCGGFTVDPTYFYVNDGRLEISPEYIDSYYFMPGYCATLTEDVNESSGTDKWRMNKDDIRLAIFNITSGRPVFVKIKTYLNTDEYAYGVGNLCYYEEGKKLIFSYPYARGTTFSVNFYDVNINTGVATVTTKQLT